MKKIFRRAGIGGILLGIMLLAAGFAFHSTAVETQAAVQNGFVTVSGSTYYYKNGKMYKGWLTLNGKKYYLSKANGKLFTGWKKSGTNVRYFDEKTGAMYTGFVKVSGKWYFFNTKTGCAISGWVTSKNTGNKRYFSKSNYAMVTGWTYSTDKTKKRYFDKTTGVLYKGFKSVDGQSYYFGSSDGYALSGWVKFSGKYRYFNKNTFAMTTGWVTSGTKKRYFDTSTGYMLTGLQKIGSSYYYFSSNGLAQTGWVSWSSSKQRYFDPSTYAMVTGTKVIDGYTCVFDSTGVLTSKKLDTSNSSVKITTPTSERTIKNFLANALKPVGQCLYIWGGGHNDSDATRKGVSSAWAAFYNSQSSSYNYRDYNDLSAANEAKGLDCSGFVGWSVYQVLQSSSGGTSYTEVSGDIGSSYSERGLGTYASWSKYAGALQPGDIGFDSSHTWIVLGLCSDGSAVILHSTPQAGVQISGTPTYGGNYSSEAISLAEKYMSMYSGYTKYKYSTSTGTYLRRGYYFRWSSSILSDPNGYKNMTAAQILADLFQ